MRGKLKFIGTVQKAGEKEATLKLLPEFGEGLKCIDGFSHLIILYWMHLRDTAKERNTLLVFPKRHAVALETGVFACRSPSRPNPIGLCVVKLLTIGGCYLTVEGLDALKGSPIIDIKPYHPAADSIPNARVPDWASQGPAT